MCRPILVWYVRPCIGLALTDTHLIYQAKVNECQLSISCQSLDGVSVECWSICQPISYWLILDWYSWILNGLLPNMLAVYWSMLGQYAADILTQCWSTYQLIVMTSTTHSKHDPCELYFWRTSYLYSLSGIYYVTKPTWMIIIPSSVMMWNFGGIKQVNVTQSGLSSQHQEQW